MNKTGKGGFKKGQSGNPKGKPLGNISLIIIIKKELAKIPQGQRITCLEILAKKILRLAIVDEDKEMIKLIWNYVDGMPKQALEHIGERSISILYVPAKEKSRKTKSDESDSL